MEKSVWLGGEDFTPDDGVSVHQQICLYPGLAGGIVIDLVGIAFDPLAGIVGQIKSLLALEGEVFLVAVIHLVGDLQFLGSDGLRRDLPAQLLQIFPPVLVGADPFLTGVGDRSGLPGSGNERPSGEQTCQRGQNAAQNQPAPGKFGTYNQQNTYLLSDGTFCHHPMPGEEEICPKEKILMGMERIDKLLATTGLWSRKEVKDMVRHGRVLVDGRAVSKAEEKADADTAEIRVDGEVVDCAPFVYLMLNKPAGLLSATEDKRQKTVLDLLPAHLRRRGLFPVGRLDKDTVGLMLLTDDGPMGHELLSPKKHVDKIYHARVDGHIDEEDVAVLASGMVLEDGLHCLPAGLEALGDGSECLVTLREGKYHQVKRMLAARGKPVTALKRLSMGPLELDETLNEGEWRPLTAQELEALKRSVNLL